MDRFLAELAPQATLFVLIATRLSAMMATAPIFSSRTVPMRLKAGLVLIVSYISLPVVASKGGAVPDGPIELATLVAREAVIGFCFGLVAQMLFAAVQTAGAFVDVNAGFAIAQTIDPTSGVNVSVLGRWYSMVATAAFLALGGHQLLVAGVVRSFEVSPPLADLDTTAFIAGVLDNADDILLIALQIGAPIVAALLITDVTLGIISRSVPQMNVFIVGMPLKIVIALAGSAVLLPTFVVFFNNLGGRMFRDLSEIVRAAGGG